MKCGGAAFLSLFLLCVFSLDGHIRSCRGDGIDDADVVGAPTAVDGVASDDAFAEAASASEPHLSNKQKSQKSVLKPPTIDISALLVDADSLAENTEYDHVAAQQVRVVEEIRQAALGWGFFQVLGHGVDPEVITRFEEMTRSFFALPLDEKLKVKRTHDNARGFANDELTKQLRDWKELFDLGHVPDRSRAASDPVNVVMDGFNQFPSPEVLPGFQEAMLEYYDACAELSRVLMGAIARGLGLSESFFEESGMREHTSYLRLNYYPVCAEPEPGQLGISRHTDAGALTVLLQDNVSSLEVYSGTKEDNGDGEWVAVQPVTGAFTINLGDMLQVWTNGRFAAPEHRVRTNRQTERFSAPFFFNPSYEAEVSPAQMPFVVDSEEELKYRPINWGEYRRARFEGDFADRGKEIQIEDFLVV